MMVYPQKTLGAGEVAECIERTRAYTSPTCSPSWRDGELAWRDEHNMLEPLNINSRRNQSIRVSFLP
jgi:hypothetical protein